MSRSEPVVALRHMLDYTREALCLAERSSRTELEHNRILNLALARLLEIVGEAANRVPREEQRRRPEIPWSRIVGMRNRLIHGYDLVDIDIIWQTITEDLPPLVEALKAILGSED